MRTVKFMVSLILILILVACQLPEEKEYQSYFSESPSLVSENEINNNKLIEIWTPEDIVSNTLRYFSHQYEEYEFKVTVVDRLDLVDTYYEALLTNNEPDLMIISAQDVGAFSGLDMFETLNVEPYYNHQF